MEAWGGIEPPGEGFADPCLTTWLPGHKYCFKLDEQRVVSPLACPPNPVPYGAGEGGATRPLNHSQFSRFFCIKQAYIFFKSDKILVCNFLLVANKFAESIVHGWPCQSVTKPPASLTSKTPAAISQIFVPDTNRASL